MKEIEDFFKAFEEKREAEDHLIDMTKKLNELTVQNMKELVERKFIRISYDRKRIMQNMG